MRRSGSPTVAVIGGGWAGCAAAVTLADAGFGVELFEAAPVLGGRARRVVRHGLDLDNGQHLMLGAYRETLDLVARLDAPAPARRALAIAPMAASQANAIALRARAWPAPFGLLAALLQARGLRFRERLAALRWFAALRRSGFRCAPGVTVAAMTATLPARVADALWHPLCLAALNTPPAEASAQVFANVLAAVFDGGADAADWIVPRGDLGMLVPDATARRLVAGGHRVATATAARIVARGAAAGWCIAAKDSLRDYDGVVVAVAPHQLAHAFAPDLAAHEPALAAPLADVAALRYEPITTAYLGYAQRVTPPDAIVRLDDRPGQWLFARDDIAAASHAAASGDTRAETAAAPAAGSVAARSAGARAPRLASVVAIAISAHGAHDAWPHAALVAACDAQLARLAPGWPACTWSQVIEEKRATYACTPSARRPVCGLVLPALALAGDYTDERFPATLEAAVRSGRRAATALAASLGDVGELVIPANAGIQH
jgi:squalene-associated FAD-dependent desaturase